MRATWRFNMKMVKSLVLGSAAALVAVGGAQAADLPVKAKAVEYVKVCSLYGAGFWYIPGTDTCIKVGVFTKFEYKYGNVGGGAPPGVANNANAGDNGGRTTRTDTSLNNTLTRGQVSFDLRTQTEYGT